MDSLITAAARALAAGDPLGALKLVTLRDDAPGLALRGIAMAQLGEFARARELLRRAVRAFGPREAVACARCVVAEAEVALASRDLRWAAESLASARATLEAHGDAANAALAHSLEIRRLLLTGRLDAAESELALAPPHVPPPLQVAHELIAAGIAMRRVRAGDARAALVRAGHAARRAGIPALAAEVASASALLDAPAARLIAGGRERPLVLGEVEALLASKAWIVDGLRHVVRHGSRTVALTKRPVLLALARELAEAWPGDVSRDCLVTRVFRLKHADQSLRARLRVEIGRLRRSLGTLAGIDATKRGYAIAPRRAREVVVLAPPVEEGHGDVLALLSDGEPWSTSALALALAASQRTVQRSLGALARAGKVHGLGRGRARRWTTPPGPGFATGLLLLPTLPTD